MEQKRKIKKLNSEELAYFCNQLVLVLKSGINLNDGLIMMLDDTKDPLSEKLLKQLSEAVSDQKSLYTALSETDAFSEYFISMVKIGEMSGHLEKVLEGLSVHYLREANLKSSVKSAVLHPVLLLIIMSAVVAVLLIKVLPIFKDVFMQISSQLGDTSSSAIEFASDIGKVVLIVVGVIILLIFALYFISFSQKGKKFLYSFFSKLFFFRNLTEKMSISRFSSAMYLLLSSGFDSSEALDLGSNVIDNPAVKSKITACQEKVKNREAFAIAICETELFPPLYSQMIRISYKSGMLDSVWGQISEKYDNDVNESLNNMVSFIEPLLVGALTVIIGVILVSVLLPLLTVMSSIG